MVLGAGRLGNGVDFLPTAEGVVCLLPVQHPLKL